MFVDVRSSTINNTTKMSSKENHSATNLVKVRASVSRSTMLKYLRKARAALAARRAEQQAKMAGLARAREVLAWQRKLGIV